MLNDLGMFSNDNIMVDGLALAQNAFKSHNAYYINPGAKVGELDVIFSDHFMQVFRLALSTDSKCAISAMSKKELEAYYAFIDYQNGVVVPNVELNTVVIALDDCLLEELACEATCVVDSAYDDCTVTHSWNTCTK